MTITEYIYKVPEAKLLNICLELAAEDKDSIELCIDMLLEANPELEEDNSQYSQLVPILMTRYTDALQEAQVMLEYERLLDKNDCI